jgi:hypothetical protein
MPAPLFVPYNPAPMEAIPPRRDFFLQPVAQLINQQAKIEAHET